jgi:hypothetical protein
MANVATSARNLAVAAIVTSMKNVAHATKILTTATELHVLPRGVEGTQIEAPTTVAITTTP